MSTRAEQADACRWAASYYATRVKSNPEGLRGRLGEFRIRASLLGEAANWLSLEPGQRPESTHAHRMQVAEAVQRTAFDFLSTLSESSEGVARAAHALDDAGAVLHGMPIVRGAEDPSPRRQPVSSSFWPSRSPVPSPARSVPASQAHNPPPADPPRMSHEAAEVGDDEEI